MFSPGQGYPLETTTSPTTSPSLSSNSTSLSPGAIAGIALGTVAMIALIGIFCLVYRRKKKRASQPENASQGPPSYPPQSGTALEANSPVAPEELWPEYYFNVNLSQGRSPSPLGAPHPTPQSPGPTAYHIIQG